jgi:hypothetical protein
MLLILIKLQDTNACTYILLTAIDSCGGQFVVHGAHHALWNEFACSLVTVDEFLCASEDSNKHVHV